jgi:hypothetical protein
MFINRRYCLLCVPFGSRQQSRKSKEGYALWSEERKAKHRQRVARKGLNRKLELIRLAGGKCLRCKYEGTPRTMSFHHRNKNEKLFGLSQFEIRSKNWNIVLQECSKCDLLCVRCHGEVEDELTGLQALS